MKNAIFVALMILSPTWITAAVPENDQTEKRILNFPEDRSLGFLYLQDESVETEIKGWGHWGNGEQWEYHCLAKGRVTVPAGKRIQLRISLGALRDLSPLALLRKDDLYSLLMPSAGDGQIKPDDRCMPHIGQLTGLKDLRLNWTNISNNGLKHLEGLHALEYLGLPDKTGNVALNTICKLHTLRGLYIWENAITNSAMSKLVELKNLQELGVGGRLINNEALTHIAQTPSLECLMLNPGIKAGNGWEQLKKLPRLKTLAMYDLVIDDAAVFEVSGISSLERLNFYRTPVTDRGIGYLKNLTSLKHLEVMLLQGPPTRQCLQSLQEMHSLESLRLPGGIVTDQDMKVLSHLTNLTSLHIGSSADPPYYTGKALKDLIPLRELKKLHLNGHSVNDDGLEALLQFPQLEELTLFGCRITKEGLATICQIKTLKKLYLYKPDIVLSDLKLLGQLPLLTILYITDLSRSDVCILDLSECSNLKEVTIRLDRKQAFIDKDFLSLTGLKKIDKLQLSPMSISDETVQLIAENLPCIEWIDLAGDQLTDKAAKALMNLKHLNHLSLDGGTLTDSTLESLCQMERLKYAGLTSDKPFSSQAVRKVHESKPDLNLVINPPMTK